MLWVQITALEQLRNEMQEELLQQSVDNNKLHHANQGLAAQLSKAEEKSAALETTVTSLADDKQKVRASSMQSTQQQSSLLWLIVGMKSMHAQFKRQCYPSSRS